VKFPSEFWKLRIPRQAQQCQGFWHYIYVIINRKRESLESLPGIEPIFEQGASESWPSGRCVLTLVEESVPALQNSYKITFELGRAGARSIHLPCSRLESSINDLSLLGCQKDSPKLFGGVRLEA